MAELLLGLDIGTSGVKVGVVAPDGRLLGLGRAPHANDSPQPGWVECPTERWWNGVLASLRQACEEAGVAPADIAAVGVSVLFPCIVPLDERGRDLYPAIRPLPLHCAARRTRPRTLPRHPLLRPQEPRSGRGNRAGGPARGLRGHDRQRPRSRNLRGHEQVFGFANTAITARLTGEFCADPTMVALSGLVDIRDPWRWNVALCERLGLDADRLPRIAAANAVVGTVTRQAADQTGLREGTPVVCGCGDVPASAVGCGAEEPGTVIYVAGSTDCVAAPKASPTPDRRWVNSAYVPPTELAGSAPLGSGGLLYLPYLQGERTPLWDPKARGSFFGLTAETSRPHLARAVLEGTAFALRGIIDCLEEVLGTSVQEIRAVGGGTRNPLWNQIKADVLRKRLAVLEFQETSALGAALLAGMGAGIYEDFAQATALARSCNRAALVEPHPERAERYDQLYRFFTGLYPATRVIAHALGEFS